MFQSIGERFNIGTTYLLRRVKKCCQTRTIQVNQTELTILSSILCAIVLVGGAASFHFFEGWEFTDAFYFCFITMSTIGFGDYVALQNEDVKPLQTQPQYVAFCIIYILFGLTVFAGALNLMVLRLLTMNTADERKDELEAIAAARIAPRVDGDVILSNTGAGEQPPSNFDFASMMRENCVHDNNEMKTAQPISDRLSPLHCANNRRIFLPLKKRHSSNEAQTLPTVLEPETTDADYSKIIINVTPRKIKNEPVRLKKRLQFPKLRYTARRHPCQSVTHLLPMQSIETPLLERHIEQDESTSNDDDNIVIANENNSSPKTPHISFTTLSAASVKAHANGHLNHELSSDLFISVNNHHENKRFSC